MRVTSSKSAVLTLIAAASALIAGCPPDGSPDGAGRESPGPQNTIDKTNGGASYVGSNACRNCHTELANIQALHGHNWILNPTQGQPPEFPQAAERAGVPNPPDGFAWTDIPWVIGGFAKEALFINRDGFILTNGAEAVDTQWHLENPPSGRTAGFAAYEPDAQTNKPYGFTCVPCHATAVTPQDEDAPLFQEDRAGFAGTWEEHGVRCEACHGPGAGHFTISGEEVVAIDLARIFIDPTGSESCFQCHNNEFDSDEGVIPAAAGFVQHGAQGNELKASGGHASFSCTICHDPHRSVLYDRANAIRNECIVCHADQSMALHEGKVFVADNGYTETLACQSCHMPLATATGSARLVPVLDFDGEPRGDNQARIADTRTHIFRINTDDADYTAMFNSAGDQVLRDPQGRAAVTVDFVCQRCHNGTGNAFGLERDFASEIAFGMHGGR